MFLGSWTDTVRIAVVGTLAFVAFVALQRVSGKRTLSSLNAFDFVVTVALASLLASAVLDRTVSLVEGVLGLALLMVLQFVATWSSVRLRPFERLIKSEPVLLAEDGRMLEDRMAQQRITPSEVLQAVRENGYGSLGEIAAVVLETNGHLSVIAKSQAGDSSALRNLRR